MCKCFHENSLRETKESRSLRQITPNCVISSAPRCWKDWGSAPETSDLGWSSPRNEPPYFAAKFSAVIAPGSAAEPEAPDTTHPVCTRRPDSPEGAGARVPSFASDPVLSSVCTLPSAPRTRSTVGRGCTTGLWLVQSNPDQAVASPDLHAPSEFFPHGKRERRSSNREFQS